MKKVESWRCFALQSKEFMKKVKGTKDLGHFVCCGVDLKGLVAIENQ